MRPIWPLRWGGRVVQMSVAEGDRVESGAVVAQLEDAQIQAQLAQAQVGALVVVALTLRITGWQWSAAELPVRVDAVVMCFLHFLSFSNY